MKKLYASLAAALTLASCGRSAPELGTNEYLIQEAQKAVSEKLKDPSSAQFSEIRISETGSVCGKVNGKNAFGAYGGASRFVYAPIKTNHSDKQQEFMGPYVEGDDVTYPTNGGWRSIEFMDLYEDHCLGISFEQQKAERRNSTRGLDKP